MKYRIAVHYEEGCIIEIEAKTESIAKALAKEEVAIGGVPDNAKIIHRDYWVTDAEVSI